MPFQLGKPQAPVAPVVQEENKEYSPDRRIIIDERERSRAKLLQHGLQKYGPTEISTIEVGDVVCGNVCVEIKMVNDFLSSFNSRLIKQTTNMTYAFPHNYLIIIGTFEDISSVSKIPRDKLHGYMASMEIRKNIHIRNFQSLTDAIVFMGKIFIKGNDDKEVSYVNPMKMSANSKDMQLNVLTAYPKISIERAKLIMKHFGSLDAFFKAEVKDLMQVEGIGKKIATDIYEINHKEEEHE